ncbi:hypothetical protein VIGAN_02270600, partial [Vigna angularis var. angularis]
PQSNQTHWRRRWSHPEHSSASSWEVQSSIHSFFFSSLHPHTTSSFFLNCSISFPSSNSAQLNIHSLFTLPHYCVNRGLHPRGRAPNLPSLPDSDEPHPAAASTSASMDLRDCPFGNLSLQW